MWLVGVFSSIVSQLGSLVLMKWSEATNGNLPDDPDVERGKAWSTWLLSLSMEERDWPEAINYSFFYILFPWSLCCSLGKIRLASLTEEDLNACLLLIKRDNETYWIHTLFAIILWIHRLAHWIIDDPIQLNYLFSSNKDLPPVSCSRVLRWPHHGQTWKRSELGTKDDENT